MLYPAIIKLQDKTVIVIGSGDVAVRKIRSLLKTGARIICISKKVDNKIRANNKKIKIIIDSFRIKYVAEYKPMIIINASGDEAVDKLLLPVIDKKNILYNSVDKPEYCNFNVPAVIEQGDLQITVSTNGKSPFMSGFIRKQLQKFIKKEWIELIKIFGKMRKRIKEAEISHPEKLKIFKKIVSNKEIKEALKRKNKKKAERLINELFNK